MNVKIILKLLSLKLVVVDQTRLPQDRIRSQGFGNMKLKLVAP